MKEITRRLYTKPVMLGMAFLIGAALLVGLFVTTGKSRAAQSGFPIVAGNDEFETPGNGETFHDFGGSPIPANFFGPGSQPFNQLVATRRRASVGRERYRHDHPAAPNYLRARRQHAARQ